MSPTLDKDLNEIFAEVASVGWTTVHGTLDSFELIAKLNGLESTAMSKGPARSTLVPHSQEDAPKRSLSAVYGLGEQPLHTDGAHLERPPDLIVLHSSNPSPTDTVVWRGTKRRMDPVPADVGTGIFTVRGNKGSFLASARDANGFRFDPVCMIPGDHLAQKTVAYFEDQRKGAYRHEWAEPDLLLFIDNRACLHARDAVVEDQMTRSVSRLTYRLEPSR